MNAPPRDEPAVAAARRLAGILEAQLELYEQVLALSARQEKLIGTGATDEIMRVLGRKQELITRIDALAAQAAPLLARWEQTREAAGADHRARIEQVVERLRRVLGEIVALEDQGRDGLGRAREDAGRRIERLQKGKAMHKAYGANTKLPPRARFQDRNG